MRAQISLAIALACGQPTLALGDSDNGTTTCSPLPPVVLQNGTSPRLSRRSLSSRRRLDYPGKGQLGRRIQIKHEASRSIRRSRRAVPWMQLDPGDLRYGRQSFHAVNLKIWFRVAGHGDQMKETGGTRHRVALEEALRPDAVGRADDRARAATKMLDHPAADCFEIARKIEFGNCRGALLCSRPERFVGVREGDPHHHGIARDALAPRDCRACDRARRRGLGRSGSLAAPPVEFHTAAELNPRFGIMNGRGFFPLPALISAIERPEATERSFSWAS